MLHVTQGNLLLAETEAIVNTVNTVGVMGKGIALMFRETFPRNYAAYATACKTGDAKVGQMFVTETRELTGPKWIVNFPTKQHWRQPSRLEWIVAGLRDLRRVLVEKGIRSVAIPPLGCGHGGLDWADVKPEIEKALGDLPGVDVMIYEPVTTYQNQPKRSGVLKLTPARTDRGSRAPLLDSGDRVHDSGAAKVGLVFRTQRRDACSRQPAQAALQGGPVRPVLGQLASSARWVGR